MQPRLNERQDPGDNRPSRFRARKSRKVRDCNGLLNTTVFVFHVFHFAHSHLLVRGVFAYKAFPLTVATVHCEPLRTLSRGLRARRRTRPHTDFYRSESFVRRRRLRLWTQTDKLGALSDSTVRL